MLWLPPTILNQVVFNTRNLASIGTYTYSNGPLSISIGGCDETSTLPLSNNETFIQISTCDTEFDDSENADGSLLGRYVGSLEIVNDGI